MNRMKIFTLLVKNQDEAIAFYCRKLGFEVAEDLAFGEGRWITLAMPGFPDTSLALELAKAPEDQAIVGHQAGSFPLLAMATLDCLGDFARMTEAGVHFHGEPQSGPWGTGVLLEDLYGNRIFLSQEPNP
jgi:catechol 2,3-dioxygenase-like lactoylglutathione lyase family enzyme